MRNSGFRIMAIGLLVQLCLPGAARPAQAQAANAAYPAMAPLDEYLSASRNAEIALARSAAPPSIADKAEVMVLGPGGFTTAVKGSNGFLCLVERSWANATGDPEFWNPKVRSPNCFNAVAARTIAPIFLMKTRLVLQGKSRTEIAAAIASALDSKQLPPLAPGAMCYMMSKQQYLNDTGKSWHPHVMFYGAGDAAGSWGANLPGSPILASNDPQERVTVFMVVVGHWSDGSPAPPVAP